MDKGIFDPRTIPLDTSCLIEASAGTGKTYSMVNIYLRHLLGIDCTALSIEQILVVTFTRAASSELKKRIREKVLQLKAILVHNRQSDDDFISYLVSKITDFDDAQRRLDLAASDIDQASIFTIDSFLVKIVQSFAFETGVRFDLKVSLDTKVRNHRLAHRAWRETFYKDKALTELLFALYPYDSERTPESLFAKCTTLSHASGEQRELLGKFKENFDRLQQEYYARHSDRSLDEIKLMLAKLLEKPAGQALCLALRKRYPFVMIDEFQDTQLQEFAIFEHLFLSQEQPSGFVMIGDPKQLIYGFRGVNLEGYLTAYHKASHHFTLNKNYRANERITSEINEFFAGVANPFVIEQVNFKKVQAVVNKAVIEGEAPVRYIFNEQGKYRTRLAQQEEMAKMASKYIAKSLSKGDQGQLVIDGVAVKSSDIAILVRDKTQALVMKRALKALNIDSLFLSEKMSVFASEQAADLLCILESIVNYRSPHAMMNALFTKIFAKNLVDLEQIYRDESVQEQYFERFYHYYQLWQAQGVLVMLSKLFDDEGNLLRLKQLNDGERMITNILHLSELLEQASKKNDPLALISYLRNQITGGREQHDEEIIRLESERKLVKIITYHGSKGLEYPIVWLPFVSDYKRREKLSEKDRFDEINLLYVAMTRAKAQLNMVLLGESLAKGLDEIPLVYLQPQLRDNPHLLGEMIDDNSENAHMYQREQQIIELSLAPFDAHVRLRESLLSFTSLIAHYRKGRSQHNELSLSSITIADRDESEVSLSSTDDGDYSPYHFKGGAFVGVEIHRFFEQSRFDLLKMEQIKALCMRLGLNELWYEPTFNWFNRVLDTPLRAQSPNFTLRNISYTQSLRELSFDLAYSNEHALEQLSHLIYRSLGYSLQLEPVAMRGIMRGSIDLVSCYEDKFYIIDYKSNHLGYSAKDYSPNRLAKVMEDSYYFVQYIIYSLALHRYLKQRKQDYDFTNHFGGVLYLFLRAMNGKDSHGVYFTTLTKEFIEELDRIFT